MLAEAAGCSNNSTAISGDGAAILDCLRQIDTDILQYASFSVGSSGNYGSWRFVPVVDDTFVRQLPSKQLLSGKVNGARVLARCVHAILNRRSGRMADCCPAITRTMEHNSCRRTRPASSHGFAQRTPYSPNGISDRSTRRTTQHLETSQQDLRPVGTAMDPR